jgi:2-iminobutanoate/2-iminopropanoate deaminase
MTRERIRLATVTTASLAALMLGIFAMVALMGQEPAAQSPSQRRAIRPEKGPNTGLPYSPGILAGNTLYVSGHLGQDPAARRVVPGGIEAETRQIFADVREVLKGAGMDLSDVVSVNVYLTNLEEFPKFNEVYREYFPRDPPARTTVGVAALNIGARVELQMVAVKP